MSTPETELVSPFVLEYAYKRSTGPVLGAFFEGLRAGRILGARTATGRVLCPPLEYDPETGQDIHGLEEVGPAATLMGWTWVDEPQPEHPCDEPFAFGLVQLDGADTAMVHLVKVPRELLCTGLRLRAEFRETREGSITDIAGFVRSNTPQPALVPASSEEPVTRILAPTRLAYTVTAGTTTADFLRGILRRELIGRRCPECTRLYLPPRGSCPTCGVRTTEQVPIGQRGTVTTFSVIRIPFEGQILDPPYAAAHVLLDGADTPLLHIVGDCDVDTVRMGMRVEAVWAEDLAPTLASVRYFQPVDEPDAPYESYREHV